ncbi:AraC-type DNA-binding protein [Catalinimonas alkaloidigena]|uniref:AraC-type DNA-binding protein n=1 Tax=Catalinimonas alkaloidigena TaxID=1075417 RepID=A0A1G9PF16_9BACT|nr:AraC family transcriptional regulator [Catalinimonas alkaloidigena]SDL97416.1 AraC-type DNA-binding protein [Catalinimonas alkaloidigena]
MPLPAPPTFYQQQMDQLRTTVYPPPEQVARVRRAKQFMERQFSERILLDALCREAFLSKFHFLRLFKRLYGQTPYQYLTSVRIQQAKLRLRQGQPARAVCFAVGFDSVGSFTTLFRKMTGTTPGTFQRRHAQKSNFQERS